MLIECIFWLSFILIAYTYFVYPLVLGLLSKLKRKTLLSKVNTNQARPSLTNDQLPSVAVIIAAFKEEKHIKARIENLLSQDYPANKLSIYVGSDGSKDRTGEIIDQYVSHPQVNVFVFGQNRGKVSVLNDLIGRVSEEVLVMTDANTEFKHDNIRQLVAEFADDKVGAVCGELRIQSSSGGQNQDGLYWQYERYLKYHEGQIGGLLGANGANYAIRTNLYQPLPKNSIIDDFLIVMNVAKQGYEVNYNIDSVAYEDEAPTSQDEYKRRIRIGAGNYQAFWRLLYFLNPFVGVRCFTYVSHKVLRWFVPHLMLIALIANLLLIEQQMYALIFGMQSFAYLLVACMHVTMKEFNYPKLFKLLYFLISMNVGLMRGFVNFSTGKATGRWSRTSR